jgi:hypothetical protein
MQNFLTLNNQLVQTPMSDTVLAFAVPTDVSKESGTIENPAPFGEIINVGMDVMWPNTPDKSMHFSLNSVKTVDLGNELWEH